MRIDVSGAVAGNAIRPLTVEELEFLDRVAKTDGVPAISGGLLGIARGEDRAHGATTASSLWRVHEHGQTPDEGEHLVGFGIRALQGDRQAGEFLIAPEYRNRGLGAKLLDAILAEEPDTWCWSHGDHPAAQSLAATRGLSRDRVLYQMRTPAPGAAALEPDGLPPTNAPQGVTLRSFAPGDEEGWMRVNNAAFSWHPEQGSQTLEDLRTIVGASDFDPDSVIIATVENRIIGFHQTKITEDGGNELLGEVYVVGVDPDIHARGVGKALTIEGMRRMVARGARSIELYVESDNEPALGLYQRLGFHVAVAHVSYAPALPQAS